MAFAYPRVPGWIPRFLTAEFVLLCQSERGDAERQDYKVTVKQTCEHNTVECIRRLINDMSC